MPFAYLRDPLFLASVALYLANRFLVKPLAPNGFSDAYVNDLLCVPIFVPLMVAGLRSLGARLDDGPPRAHEVLVPLLLWGYLFEVMLPRTATFGPLTTADPADFLAYTAGAGVAVAFWGWRYAARSSAPS